LELTRYLTGPCRRLPTTWLQPTLRSAADYLPWRSNHFGPGPRM
jgi:hypothetical protein